MRRTSLSMNSTLIDRVQVLARGDVGKYSKKDGLSLMAKCICVSRKIMVNRFTPKLNCVLVCNRIRFNIEVNCHQGNISILQFRETNYAAQHAHLYLIRQTTLSLEKKKVNTILIIALI